MDLYTGVKNNFMLFPGKFKGIFFNSRSLSSRLLSLNKIIAKTTRYFANDAHSPNYITDMLFSALLFSSGIERLITIKLISYLY